MKGTSVRLPTGVTSLSLQRESAKVRGGLVEKTLRPLSHGLRGSIGRAAGKIGSDGLDSGGDKIVLGVEGVLHWHILASRSGACCRTLRRATLPTRPVQEERRV